MAESRPRVTAVAAGVGASSLGGAEAAGGGGGTTLGSRLRRFSMQIPRKMSAHNVMASISRTLGTRYSESKATNEIKFAGEESKDRLYEPKHKQKLVRVLTVVAYIISVSLAAIVLSLYYMYIWDPSDHTHILAKQKNASEAARLACAPQEPIAMPVRNASAALLDKTESDMDQMVPPTPSPEFGVRDLLKVLSIPKQRIKSSATDYPQPLPSISSDQFQAAPMMVDEGVTTESYSDDVLED